MSLFSKIKGPFGSNPTDDPSPQSTNPNYSLAETLKGFQETEAPQDNGNDSAPSDGSLIYKITPIINKILSTQTLREIIFSLTDELNELFQCEAVTIFALDRSTRQLFSRNFKHDTFNEIRLNVSLKSLAGYVAATGKSLCIKNAYDREELRTYHPELELDTRWDQQFNFKTRSVLAFPLGHNKRLMGVIEIINKKNKANFEAADLQLAKEMGATLGHALMKLEWEDIEEKLKATSHAIHTANTIDDILMRFKESILQLFSADQITIYAVDSAANEIYSKVKTGDSINEIRVPISPQSIAGYVAKEQCFLNIHDVYDDAELNKLDPVLSFDPSWDRKSGLRTRSMLVYPICYENTLMGVLQLVNKNFGKNLH